MNLNDIWSAKSKLAEARAATASFRASNKKRAELNAMSPEERKAHDKEQQEKQRKRDDARLEKERQKNAAKKQGVAGGLNEFAPAGGGGNIPRGPKTPKRDPWGDNGEDPYQLRRYNRSIDFFDQFDSDGVDKQKFDKATGEYEGYYFDRDSASGITQIAYFKFDDPTKIGDNDPGAGWYYEPVDESLVEGADISNLTPSEIKGIWMMIQNSYDIPTIIRTFDNKPTPEQITAISMANMKQGVAEAKGLNKRVRVVKTGETGTIRQVKHGAFKGAPKSYFVDLDNGKQADNLPASALRLIKKQGVAEGNEPEGKTVKNSLHTIIRVATHLERQIDDSEDFAEWESETIGSIKDQMVKVMDYEISKKEQQGVAEGQTPEQEIERLKLRQNAEHGGASLKRQAATQARIRELEKQIKDKKGVAEGSQTVGHEILGMLRQVKRQGDDAMEELYSSCPLLAQFWDQYEGDFRSMVIELSPKTLIRIKAEISAFNQQGVEEGAFDKYSPMAQQQIAKDKEQALHNTGAMEVIHDLINGSLDGYDVMNHPRTPAQKVVAQMMQDKYENISINNRLHGDDDFEEIISRVIDDFEADYGVKEGMDAYEKDVWASQQGFNRPHDHRGLGQELAHERNNIQVTINGKPWRVFPGRGTADSREEWSHLQSMKDWAAKKSASTGKKWSVSLTGANPTMEETVSEGTGLSAELLANYKKAAGISARDLDKAGKYDKANKRFSGIVQATKKEFDNDAKKHNKQEDVSSIPQDDTTSPIHEDIESRLHQMKRAGYDL